MKTSSGERPREDSLTRRSSDFPLSLLAKVSEGSQNRIRARGQSTIPLPISYLAFPGSLTTFLGMNQTVVESIKLAFSLLIVQWKQPRNPISRRLEPPIPDSRLEPPDYDSRLDARESMLAGLEVGLVPSGVEVE